MDAHQIAEIVARTVASVEAENTIQSTIVTAEQQKMHDEHLKRLAEVRKTREANISGAAKAILPEMLNDDIDERVAALFIRAGVQTLSWTHHRNRGFMEYLNRRITEAKEKGTNDQNIDHWEEMLRMNSEQNDWIEVLALAGQMKFEKLSSLIERRTNEPFTLTIDFDVSDEAYAQHVDKEAAKRAKANKANAAVSKTGNDLLALAATPSAIVDLATKS